MRRQSTSWFQGWKITLRCAEFRCDDGKLRYASTVILRHLPPPLDRTSLHWPEEIRRTIIFPDEAFGTREEANDDAAARGKREVLVLNGRGCQRQPGGKP